MNERRTPSFRAAALWILPIVALFVYAGKLTDWGRDISADSVPWRKTNSPTLNNGVVPDIAFNSDASAYAAITDRNLFVPWRKPAPPPEAPKAPVEPPKPQIRRGVYQLTGTMQIGADTFAMVKENATNRSKRVKVGDDLQEYKVQSVDNERVVLAFAGQTEELVLARYTQSGRAIVPPAAAPIPPPPAPVAAAMPAQAVPVVQPRPAEPTQPPPNGLPPFPPSVGMAPQGAAAPQSAPPAAPVGTVPVAQQPQPEIIDVGELLRRRREARKQ